MPDKLCYPGELLGGDAAPDGRCVIGDRVDAVDSVEGEVHEMQHLPVQVRLVQPVLVRRHVPHDESLPSVDEGDGHVHRRDLMQRHRIACAVSLDDREGIAVAEDVRHDAEPEGEDVGIFVG